MSDANYEPLENINSIVSKIDGTLLNVNVLSSETGANGNKYDKEIEILTDNYGTLLCMENSTNNLLKCGNEDNNNNSWHLKYVNNSVVMNNILDNSNLGQSSTKINYPFFMVLTNNNKLALQYNNGRYSVAPAGNYDSQKWDVSEYKIPQKQLFENDIYDAPLDKMPFSQNSNPNDRVKINLNVNDERLKELLNIQNNNDNGTEEKKCGNYIPKEAAENLCSGCKF